MTFEIEVWKQTSKHSGSNNTCEYIVLHHTWWEGVDQQANYLGYGSTQVSCHYVVGKGGEIIQISDDKYITRHAWSSQWDGRLWMNSYSIGIEIVSGDGHSYTDIQRDAVDWLVKNLMNKHWLSKDEVIRHKDISPWRKRDVGDEFWNTRFSTFTEYQNSLMPKKEEITNKKRLQSLHIEIRDMYQVVSANPDFDDTKTLEILAKLSKILREEWGTWL